MSARIDAVNLALIWLGATPITSLEDETTDALIMKINYDLARDATLEAHEWSFAMKRWEGAKDAEAPVFGAANKFVVPSDIIRVTAVYRTGDGLGASLTDQHSIDRQPQADWKLESGYIITNEDSIYCKGIRSIEDEGIFSPLFIHAFAAHLATLCAYAITESDGKFNAMSALYTLKIQEARSRDAVQGSNKRIRNRSMQNVR